MRYRAYLLKASTGKLFAIALGGLLGLVLLFAVLRLIFTPEIYKPWSLSENEYPDFHRFAVELQARSDPFSQYIYNSLDTSTQKLLSSYTNNQSNAALLRGALTRDLNALMRGDLLFSENRIGTNLLSDTLQSTVADLPVSGSYPSLNRLILSSAYRNLLPQQSPALSMFLSAARASFERQTVQSESTPPFGRTGRAISWSQAITAHMYYALIIGLISFRLMRRRENIVFPSRLAYNHLLRAFEIRFVNLDASDLSDLNIRAFIRKRISRSEDELIRDMMFPVKLTMPYEPYTESMMVVALRTSPQAQECDLQTGIENAITIDTLDGDSSFIITVAATSVDSGENTIVRKIYRFHDIIVGQYRDIETDLPVTAYGDSGSWRHRHYHLFNTIDGPGIPANEWRKKHGREGIATFQTRLGSRVIRFPDEHNARDHIQNILSGKVYQKPKLIDFQPDLIIDIGANVGASTAYFLQTYPDARAICYEPHTRNFDYLKRNLAGLNVEVFPVGLFSEEKDAVLLEGKKQCMQHSLFKSAEVSDTGERIKLRDALSELKPLVEDRTLIKIDTEGCEGPILQRIEPLLHNIAIIYFEFHSESDRRRLDALLSKTHSLWNCKIDYVHRGDACYVLRELWNQSAEIAEWEIKS